MTTNGKTGLANTMISANFSTYRISKIVYLVVGFPARIVTFCIGNWKRSAGQLCALETHSPVRQMSSAMQGSASIRSSRSVPSAFRPCVAQLLRIPPQPASRSRTAQRELRARQSAWCLVPSAHSYRSGQHCSLELTKNQPWRAVSSRTPCRQASCPLYHGS